MELALAALAVAEKLRVQRASGRDVGSPRRSTGQFVDPMSTNPGGLWDQSTKPSLMAMGRRRREEG
jgi:hypothetical protein